MVMMGTGTGIKGFCLPLTASEKMYLRAIGTFQENRITRYLKIIFDGGCLSYIFSIFKENGLLYKFFTLKVFHICAISYPVNLDF
jgi:hypothetical protein